ncbi:hypothetical protein IAT38_004899 [Cryptococcus sp. DSM 104549]
MRFQPTLRWTIPALLLAGQGVQAITDFEAVSVVKDFADAFLAPRNVEVAKSINSTLFAEDVKGTVDLSTNFDGRELTTEYLFGLFVNTADDGGDPSPFGSPVSYNVTALLVQNHFVSASIKFEFNYPILNKTFPIQVDAFMLINENRQIQQYDASFRRWAWATDYIIPQLIPYMAASLSLPATNTSNVLRQYLSRKICETAVTHCTGANQQYEDYDHCMEWLEGREVGEWYRMGEDNLVCRHLHVPMLPLRPSVHCEHIGPTGGDMCIARDYENVVLDSHFATSWLAPKVVTPENEDEVGHIEAVSGKPLDPLLEISLSASNSHSWDPTFYPTALLGYMLFMYVCSHAIWFVYQRRSPVFPTLGLEHQKNVVIYTMNIIFTTIALALELVASPAFAGRYAFWEVQSLRTAGALTSALYIFELVYRVTMRMPLIAHHFLTIIAISITVTMFEYTQSMSYLVSAVIWLFQATTEQPTFFGLLGYRLGWNEKSVAWLLKFAALQTFVLKSASAIALIAYWGIHQNYSYNSMDRAWTAVVFIIAVGLLLTQIWGSYVTYAIGARITSPSRRPRSAPDTRRQSVSEGYQDSQFQSLLSQYGREKMGTHKTNRSVGSVHSGRDSIAMGRGYEEGSVVIIGGERPYQEYIRHSEEGGHGRGGGSGSGGEERGVDTPAYYLPRVAGAPRPLSSESQTPTLTDSSGSQRRPRGPRPRSVTPQTSTPSDFAPQPPLKAGAGRDTGAAGTHTSRISASSPPRLPMPLPGGPLLSPGYVEGQTVAEPEASRLRDGQVGGGRWDGSGAGEHRSRGRAAGGGRSSTVRGGA